MNNEELETQLMLLKNAVVSLHEHLAPEFKTRDLVLLKYGFTEKEISELDRYFMEIFMNKLKPTKKEFRKKLAEIKGVPELTAEVVKDVLEGYKADGLHTNTINKILK
ncbi:hypothetical protein [Aeribacillus alveayuensis]|uniref:Uncharacterized protein n=1 Tax=Aeribacillus alveayuensis TaxID=279215 RepID=A0ABT9VQB8_9BACI|nr:hypothetical protein [Bacillus alveayuensis]